MQFNLGSNTPADGDQSFHPSLRLHTLQGRVKSLYSISITMMYRLTAEFIIEENEILLIYIESHKEVYSR